MNVPMSMLAYRSTINQIIDNFICTA
uniref:Uncharacterized protein n=1 Tax=Arundo donax TaxID=35708 RepID=A0A0A8ZVP8_ARUDO